MKWFKGNINEAVTASKSKKAIFVVFVEGKDETSLKITEVIDSPEISSRLERDDFVAIKLEGGSESYGFFAQIYQLVPIPSLFFIGQNGAPIEVIAGEISVADLTAKIDTVLSKVDPSTSLIQSEQKEASGSDSSETEVKSTVLETKSEKEMTPVPKAVKQEQSEAKIPTSEVLETAAKASPEAPSASSSTSDALNKPELTPEEKLERARKLIELQKKQRDEEEAKRQREREIARRKSGQEMLRIKQQQQDLEIKQAQEERRKEKAAEAAARDKVRQQIAQDKLERKQRELDLQKQQSPVQEQPKPRTPVTSDSNVARIQFRLPNGNPHTGQFDSTSTLGALRSYVVENIELPFRNFALSTTFPRRDLTAADDDKTLLELELVPTAVVLILPLKNTSDTTAVTSSQDVGFLSGLIWSIYATIISAFGYMKGYFTRPDPPRGGNQQNSNSASGGVTPTTSNANRPNVQAGLLRRNIGGPGSSIRAQGNVHRLHSGSDQDDENNTWNGNSTQQM